MKAKIQFLTMMFVAALFATACDDDDNDNVKVPAVVEQALKAKYPSATRIEWELKGNYYVADCRLDGKEIDVWFGREADWVLTETDLLWDDLPAAVQTAFESSDYASWRKDGYELLEYPLEPMQYVIEVEQGNTEIQLFYSESGNLMQTRDVTGKSDTHWPLVSTRFY